MILGLLYLLSHRLISVSGPFQRSLHHGEDEEAPDQTEDDRAGEEEVEDGDLQFSNLEREY